MEISVVYNWEYYYAEERPTKEDMADFMGFYGSREPPTPLAMTRTSSVLSLPRLQSPAQPRTLSAVRGCLYVNKCSFIRTSQQ